MSHIHVAFVKFLLVCLTEFFFFGQSLESTIPPPYEPTLADKVNEEQIVRVFEVIYGINIELKCESNDLNHNFDFWVLPNNQIIGPRNNDNFDQNKFDYEVLTGKLKVKAVSRIEEGFYLCVSKGVHNDDINIRTFRIIVKQEWENVPQLESITYFFKITIALTSLLILSGLVFLVYKIRKRNRSHEYLENDYDDEESEGDEIFRAPGTSRNDTSNIVLEKSISVDTDFGGILNSRQ